MSAAERLSQRLLVLRSAALEGPLTVGRLLEILEERGQALLVFVLTVPFLQPIPLPGISTLFGLTIAAIGWRMMRGGPLWLPARLLARAVATRTVANLCDASVRLLRRFEHLIKPRLGVLCAPGWRHTLYAVVLVLAGLALSLPLPVPASNFLPALSIALLALGMLEQDGLLILLGYVVFAAAVALIVAIFVFSYLGLR